jgi:hypothetical protein
MIFLRRVLGVNTPLEDTLARCTESVIQLRFMQRGRAPTQQRKGVEGSRGVVYMLDLW